jgi:phenylacetate-CoA ligase
MWLGRSWYGVSPASRLFLLWGHSHLLGAGIKGWLNARKRMVLDRMLGYFRFSAYDLRPEVLGRAALKLIRFKPDYLIGYSIALDLFASANTSLREELRALGMKMAVGAAEGFPSSESEARLGDLFGCPIAMEYGAVETGLMAHTHPSGGYRVYWRTYFMEAERRCPESHNMTVRITNLYPRCTPLVRYEIGDEIETWEHKEERILGLESFKRVVGRCNDYVLLEDGARIHSEAFTHAVRACPVIGSYQVVQSGTHLCIRYTSDVPLNGSHISQIRERLGKIHLALGRMEFERVDRLMQTVAGKTRMVIKN